MSDEFEEWKRAALGEVDVDRLREAIEAERKALERELLSAPHAWGDGDGRVAHSMLWRPFVGRA